MGLKLANKTTGSFAVFHVPFDRTFGRNCLWSIEMYLRGDLSSGRTSRLQLFLKLSFLENLR